MYQQSSYGGGGSGGDFSSFNQDSNVGYGQGVSAGADYGASEFGGGRFENIVGSEPVEPPVDLNRFGFRRAVVGESVAINVEESDWILAKVVSYDRNYGSYKLVDADADAQGKQYALSQDRVRTLFFNANHGHTNNNSPKLLLNKGDIIHAIYPDTTSFYEATVVRPPRIDVTQVTGGTVGVYFKDDHDEFGNIPERPVYLSSVMVLGVHR